MPLNELDLDTRTAEQIVSEAKRRIPSYTPEWTDQNESDPGMALVELFGWISEMIIYRLNQVPEKNYRKFLQLLGISLRPATAARADLAFKLTTPTPPDDGFVVIPQGTQVSLSDGVEGGPVIFETEETMYAVGPELTDIQSFDSARFVLIDEEHRGAGQKFFAFGDGPPRRGSALYLGFNGPLPQSEQRHVTLALFVFSEELAAGRKALLAPELDGHAEDENAADSVADQAPKSADLPPARMMWEFLAGENDWRPLVAVEDFTEYLTRSGKVRFRVPGAMHPQLIGQLRRGGEEKKRFWVRLRIVDLLGGGYQTLPQLENVAVNTVGAVNAITVTDELLGASDGSMDQRFQLARQPVEPGSLVLAVFESDRERKFVTWKRVEDFAKSQRDSRHYTLNALTGEIGFGDGTRGMIPPRLPAGEDETTREKDAPNIRALRYRWGGGARGNAGAGKITGLESAIPLVEKVINPRPAEGGADMESLEDAKKRAPETIRTRSRAVTGSDFEALARQTPGAHIKRARALPGHHPNFAPPRPAGDETEATPVRIPGVVTVVVVPAAAPNVAKPMPTEETLARVGRHLNRHRLITTELFVAPPKYREVTVEVSVKVKRTANLREVEEKLQRRLLAYFHPLTGGAENEGWEFGRKIEFSKTFSQIFNTPGVASVESDTMRTKLDETPHDSCKDIPLAPDEIVFSTKHLLTLNYE